MSNKDCATCNGWMWNVRLGKWVRTRTTVGLVCPACGHDYGADNG